MTAEDTRLSAVTLSETAGGYQGENGVIHNNPEPKYWHTVSVRQAVDYCSVQSA
jgi:hypothetical protein